MAEKYIISILSHKGGGGKTLTSHLLAWGLAYMGKRVVHMSTDSVRTLKSDANRPYRCVSGKTEDELKKVIENFRKFKDPDKSELPDIYLIIDGGAGKHVFDEWLAEISTIVLSPVKNSFDDFEAAILDLKRMPNCIIFKNEWPYEYLAIPKANAKFDAAFKHVSNRILDYVIVRSLNLKLINDDEELGSIKSEIFSKGKSFAYSVTQWIKDHPKT